MLNPVRIRKVRKTDTNMMIQNASQKFRIQSNMFESKPRPVTGQIRSRKLKLKSVKSGGLGSLSHHGT